MITAPHLHAMVIHFPIALLMIGFLFEILALSGKSSFFRKASFYLLVFGAMGAIFAYASGSYASDGMTDALLEVPLELHEDSALITMWLAIVLVLLKTVMFLLDYQRIWAKWAMLLLYAILVGFVARTGYLGGQLVFKHGAGIELTLPDFGDSTNE